MPTTNTPVYVVTDRANGPYWRITARRLGSGSQIVRFSGIKDEEKAVDFTRRNARWAFNLDRASIDLVIISSIEPVTVLRRIARLSQDDAAIDRVLPHEEMTADERAVVAADEKAAHPVCRNLPYPELGGTLVIDDMEYNVSPWGKVSVWIPANGSRRGYWRDIKDESSKWYDVNLEFYARQSRRLAALATKDEPEVTSVSAVEPVSGEVFNPQPHYDDIDWLDSFYRDRDRINGTVASTTDDLDWFNYWRGDYSVIMADWEMTYEIDHWTKAQRYTAKASDYLQQAKRGMEDAVQEGWFRKLGGSDEIPAVMPHSEAVRLRDAWRKEYNLLAEYNRVSADHEFLSSLVNAVLVALIDTDSVEGETFTDYPGSPVVESWKAELAELPTLGCTILGIYVTFSGYFNDSDLLACGISLDNEILEHSYNVGDDKLMGRQMFWTLKIKADEAVRQHSENPSFFTGRKLREMAIACRDAQLIDAELYRIAWDFSFSYPAPRIDGETFIPTNGPVAAPEFDQMEWRTPWVINGVPFCAEFYHDNRPIDLTWPDDFLNYSVMESPLRIPV